MQDDDSCSPPWFPTELSLLCRLCVPTEQPCGHFKEEGKQSESAWCSSPRRLSGNGFACQKETGCAKARTFRQGPSALLLPPPSHPQVGHAPKGPLFIRGLWGECPLLQKGAGRVRHTEEGLGRISVSLWDGGVSLVEGSLARDGQET